MNALNQILEFLQRVITFWFVVMPWEQAVRVRAGRKPKVLGGGFYLMVPLIDRVYINGIRQRMVDTAMQTVTTADGVAITYKALLGYKITDIHRMYNTIAHPDMTLAGIVQGKVAEYISSTKSSELTKAAAEDAAMKAISKEDYGLGNLSVAIVSWASVRAFRLIQDQSWQHETVDLSNVGEKRA